MNRSWRLGAPPCETERGERVLPETGDKGAQQQLLDEAHARVRRHFKRPEFQQAKPARGAVGGVPLNSSTVRRM